MYQAVEHSILGTVARLTVEVARPRRHRRAADRVFAEMRRLSGVFNIFDETSEISQLRRTSVCSSDELGRVLTLAEGWHSATGGLFDPAPGSDRLPWRSESGEVAVDGDCSAVDLNAIAKGWIIDHAATCAGRGVDALVLDVGGDVLHLCGPPIRVGIENPHRAYDNEPPVAIIELNHAAVATSGPARRGGHLRDPRNGSQPTAVASASVVATDAATADVLATALAVGTPAEGIDLANALGVGAMVISDNGARSSNSRWDGLLIGPEH